jgi:hypothetical protein
MAMTISQVTERLLGGFVGKKEAACGRERSQHSWPQALVQRTNACDKYSLTIKHFVKTAAFSIAHNEAP